MMKKLLALVLVFAMALSLAVPAMAASAPKVEPTELTWTDGFGFHCNKCGGNGATAVIYKGDNAAVIKAIGNIKKQPAGSLVVEKGDQKDIFGTKTYPIKLERVGTTTEWNLMTEDIVCATCGRADWVTYSNNSGVINGKNIQAHHPALPEPPPPVDPKGGLSFTKTVEGIDILVWLEEFKPADKTEILAGIFFDLCTLDEEVVKTAQIEEDPINPIKGNIVDFGSDIIPGEYMVVERFEGVAVGVFKDHAPVFVTIIDGQITGIGGESKVPEGPFTGVLGEFKYYLAALSKGGLLAQDAVAGNPWKAYWRNDVWPSQYTGDYISTPHLLVYRLSVIDGSGNEFVSFCGNIYEHAFNDGLVDGNVIPEGKKDRVIKALDWIYNQYGSFEELNDYEYAIAQMLVWSILFDLDEITIAKANDSPFILATLALVNDIISKYEAAYTGQVVDVLELVSVSANGQPQLVPIIGGGFDNKPNDPPSVDPKGSLSFEKKVEGLPISTWLDDNGLSSEILGGLEFYLDGVGIDGKVYNYGPAYPDFYSMVSFGTEPGKEIYPGTYTLSEKITDKAVGVFKKMADIPNIIIGDGEDAFLVLGGTVTGNIAGPDIKDGDRFTVFNGYTAGMFDWGYDANGIGYPGLNATGHIFYIGVKNQRTDEIFYSFCANGGSENFGNGPYLVAHSMKERDWIMAFNYINDKYGDLNENRVITQLVTWALLGAVDVNSEAFENTKLTDVEKTAIKDVMENYKDYVGNGEVVDVLFMTDVNTPFFDDGKPNYKQCQPQIVPVFGTFFVENEPEEIITPKVGDVSFNKTKYDGLLTVGADEFAFDLFKIVDDDKIYVDTFYTDFLGKVEAKKLEPGEYVFREVWALVFDDGLGFDEDGNEANIYNLVWKAIYPDDSKDGLYFAIDANGECVWPEYDLDEDGNPTVDNKIYCKHHVMWGAGDDFYFSLDYDLEKCGGGNIIKFGDYCDGTLEVVGNRAPSCEACGILWLGCSENCGIGTGIEYGEKLEHDINKPIALAPGYGDGFVWFICSNCGAAKVEYNKDAWLVWGGYEFVEIEEIETDE